ncbi:MAG: WD40 repeat domain-containing protein, partial [Planctomycetota bacterium]
AKKNADAVVEVAQQRLTQREAASVISPNDATLKQAAAEAQQTLNTAQASVQSQQQAVATALQNATTSATAANEAAQKVVTAQKPYNDALAAVKMAENAVRLAKQQDEIAQRELQQSQAKVPVVKEQLAGSEQALADAKAALESATQLLTESDQAIRSVTFSPDGRYLATAGDFSSAHLWDSEKGTALGAFAGHQDALVGISFLNDQYLVTGSNDQSAVVWELSPSWKLERTIGSVEHPEMISDRVMSVDFSADSSQILVAGGVPSRTGEFHVFQVADGTRTFSQPQAHDDVIHAARFSPDGKRIATAGADKYVRTFDPGSNQMLRRFEGHTNYVLGLAWKSDGQTLVSSGADDSIKVWDPDTGDQRVTISNNFRKHVTSVRFIGDSDTIVSSCGDRIVRMHTASNGGNIRNFNGATAWLHCVDSTPNLEYLAAGAADGSIRIWNGTNGQLLHTITSGPQEAPVK